MPSKILSAATIGIECELVEIEADTSGHLPGMQIVGLPDKAVDESKERVRSAIKNSSATFPRNKVTINMAPADLKKHGPSYDVPIAISILITSGQIPPLNDLRESLFIGELSLDGRIRPTSGNLSIALKAQKENIKNLFLPCENALEASLIPDINIYPVSDLKELISHLLGIKKIIPFDRHSAQFEREKMCGEFDMMHVKGQQIAKRALEIAASGGHNLLMCGPPGSGKTLLAKTVSSILPKMTLNESLEVTKIYSVAGLLPPGQGLINYRPLRKPHHSASGVSLVGGGAWPKPGEISLAHRGVLFMDEFPEFPRSVLENLRQPLEDGTITISRAQGVLQFPAKFILIAAMNPCPCGYFNDPGETCTCSAGQITSYQKKLSGPLLDRIDIHLEVPRVNFEKLATESLEESSQNIRVRVQKTRDIQEKRFGDCKIITNAEMTSQQIKEFCKVDEQILNLLRTATTKMRLSARSYYKVLKLSRTIADLADSEKIQINHVAEALQYRPKE